MADDFNLLARYLQNPDAVAAGADAPMSRLASAMTYGKGSVQPIAPPRPSLALLSSFGQPSLDLVRGVADEWQRTGQVPERNPWDVIGTMPMGPFGSVRAPRQLPPRPQQPSNNIFNDPGYYRINQEMMDIHDSLPREIRDELQRVWVPINAVQREYQRFGLEPTLRWLRALPEGVAGE